MIAGGHDEGVVQLAFGFECGDGAGDHGVEALDFDEVIEDVIADDPVVRKDLGNEDRIGIFPRLGASSKFKTAMGRGRIRVRLIIEMGQSAPMTPD